MGEGDLVGEGDLGERERESREISWNKRGFWSQGGLWRVMEVLESWNLDLEMRLVCIK